MNAAFFYAEHFSKIKRFVDALNQNESKAAVLLQKCIEDEVLQRELFNISQFKYLTETITKLTVREQHAILTKVKSKLSGDELEKLNSCLSKNPDVNFSKSCQLTNNLNTISLH